MEIELVQKASQLEPPKPNDGGMEFRVWRGCSKRKQELIFHCTNVLTNASDLSINENYPDLN